MNLLNHAEAALEMGFYIFPLSEKSKVPPAGSRGFKDSTFSIDEVQEIWKKNPNLNVGIDLGSSDLCVLDFDSEGDIPSWVHDLRTLKVKTSRGLHVYLWGARPTKAMHINGKHVGEIKSIGGYVLGAGSVHPDGPIYTTVDDSPIAYATAFEEQIAELLKESKAPIDCSPNGQKIPRGQHDNELHRIAGKLRHIGEEEEAIYTSLVEICEKRCEDYGSDYLDMCRKHARNICKKPVGESAGISIGGTPTISNPPIEFVDDDEELDIDALERKGLPIVEYPDPGSSDFVSLFGKDLVAGTNIPLAFVREPLKYMVNHLLDGHFIHPAWPSLSLRGTHFSIGETCSGKTTGFDFALAWMKPEFAARNILVRNLLAYKSEPLFVKSLSLEMDKKTQRRGNPHQFLYVKEGNEIAEKRSNDYFRSVFAKITDLYDQTEAETGSFTNGQWHATDVKISVVICFTPDDFRRTFQGSGAVASGGLPRWTMACPAREVRDGDWDRLPADRLERSFQLLRSRLPAYGAAPIVLTEDEGAKAIRLEAKKHFEMAGKLGARIIEAFVREQVNRAVMSIDQPNVMTAHDAGSIYEWALRLQEAREKTWPVDAGNPIEVMEVSIRHAVFKARHRLSESKLRDVCHYYRPGSGGAWAFDRALQNLRLRDIKRTGMTQRGRALYCPKGCAEHADLDAKKAA